MDSRNDSTLAALLLASAISFGTAGAAETPVPVKHLDIFDSSVAEYPMTPSVRHSIGLTARLEVATPLDDPPKTRVVTRGVPDSPTNVAPEPAPIDADEGYWHPNKEQQSWGQVQAQAQAVPNEPGGAGWIAGGILVAIPIGLGGGAALAQATPNNNDSRTFALAFAGGAVAAVGGYFLGTLARNGSSAAKGTVTTLAVIEGVAVVVVGVVAAMWASSGSVNGSAWHSYYY